MDVRSFNDQVPNPIASLRVGVKYGSRMLYFSMVQGTVLQSDSALLAKIKGCFLLRTVWARGLPVEGLFQ